MAAIAAAARVGATRSLSSMFSSLRLGTGAASWVIDGQRSMGSLASAGRSALPKHCTALQALGAGSFGKMMLHAGSAMSSAECRHSSRTSASAPAGLRGINSTAPRGKGLNDFFVSFPDVDKDGKPVFPAAGRAWTAAELRQKSFEDLHKLWWILLKERNSLAVERHAARARSLQIPNPRRIRKVRKSMSRIMCVLGERKRMKALIRSQGRDAGSASM